MARTFSPCYTCRRVTCYGCKHNVYAGIASVKFYSDQFVEDLWRECDDIAWSEGVDGQLLLDQPWRGFPVGEFTQDDWLQWVDKHHTRGVGWVYENNC